MHLTSGLLMLAIAAQAALANPSCDVHTTCYNHFLNKDGCVFASAEDQSRCPAPPKQPPQEVCKVAHFGRAHEMGPPPPYKRLAKRYDATQKSTTLCNGAGICGTYDTHHDEGACLWVGPNANCPDPASAGWLSQAHTTNCGKRLYVQRAGDPSSVVFVPVIDGCTFEATDAEVGCFQIALTSKTFESLNPTPEERERQAIDGITWDFDNLNGSSCEQGPM